MFITPTLLSVLPLLPLATASGFTTYKQLTEGADNTDALTYSDPKLSTTLWVYVQILPTGGSHSSLWSEFRQLATTYAAHNISVIPRVRYGTSDGSITPEPSDSSIIAADVLAWASLLNDTKNSVNYPIIQAGFLGQWGEWHDGPFCESQGSASSAESLAVKKDVLSQLRATGLKIALRYPRDHNVLVGSRSEAVTLHDDCIFAQGPGGEDEGTYTPGDGLSEGELVEYAKEVAGDNGYGGEGCQGTYDWSDYGALCGADGLARYIGDFKMAYLNPLNPGPMGDLFNDPSINQTCLGDIQKALEAHQM